MTQNPPRKLDVYDSRKLKNGGRTRPRYHVGGMSREVKDVISLMGKRIEDLENRLQSLQTADVSRAWHEDALRRIRNWIARHDGEEEARRLMGF